MNVQKYRFYLLVAAFIAILAAIIVFLLETEQEKTYQDGTLVQNMYVVGEELL